MLTNYRDFMNEHAEKYPSVPMYIYRDPVTNERIEVFPSEFKDQVLALAAFILKEGYEHKHLGIFSPNSYNYLLVRQALLCCGCTVVFLDIRMENEELVNLIFDSECSAFFTSADGEDRAKELSGAGEVPLLYMSKLPEYIETGKKLREEGKFLAEDVEIDPDAMAFLYYTSGTTGRNKGVMLSQRNYMFDKSMEYEQESYAAGDTILVLPLTHVISETSHLVSLMSGHSLYINHNIRHLFDDIKNERPEFIAVVPLFVQSFMDQLWKSIRDAGKEEQIRKQIEENRSKGNVTLEEKREIFADELSIFGGRLYKIISAGAPIAPRLIEEFQDFGIDVLCGYGCTETSGCSAVNRYGHNRVGSSGWPLMGSEIKIDNPDKNGVGEICMKGDHVMLGYYHKEEETKETLRDGWLHSGDCGYFDEDNYLYVTGRIKNLIILSNGENVSPEEIERRIAKNPGVKEVQVYAENEDIVTDIYPDIDYLKSINIDDVDEYIKNYVFDLNESLADYKRINIVRVTKEPLEKTSSGKIKRK